MGVWNSVKPCSIILRAQHDVGVQALLAQVEEPVLEAHVLRVVAFLGDLEGQHVRRRLEGEFLDLDLDLARGQARVRGLGGARHDLAGHGDDALGARLLDRREDRARRVHHALGDAVVVPEVDEEEVAVVALAMDPAGQPDGLADLRKAQLAAVMGPIGVHGSAPAAKTARKAHNGP
jgi:hypothetical protein